LYEEKGVFGKDILVDGISNGVFDGLVNSRRPAGIQNSREE